MPKEEQAVEEFDIYVGGDPAEDDTSTEPVDYGNDLPDDNPPEDPPAEDPPAEDPPAEDPPAEDPPAEDPPAEDPPAEDPPAEDPPAEDPPKSDQRIPKDRFDNVNERRKAAEKELEELKAAAKVNEAAQEGTFDFDAKEKQYMELVVDGEFDEANAIRKEIRAAEQVANQRMISDQQQQTQNATKESIAFDNTVASLEEQYPAFNKDNEAYSQDLVDEALSLFEGFVGQGLDMSAALTKASKYVAKMNDLEDTTSAAPVEETNDDPPKTPGKKPVNKDDLDKKVDASNKQPPKMPQANSDKTEVVDDIASMSEEEFDALPESKKKAMRGDSL